jgi:outer membrane protein OmpA-like peptidoglycan-associated protein
MRQIIVTAAALALVAGGSTACATKKFVTGQVGQVSSKVDSVSKSLEETQDRVKKNEAKISEVDQKAQAARGAADQAQQAAVTADGKAATAADTAKAAGAKAEAVDKATKRILYEVVLSEDSGNFKFGSADLPDGAKAKIDEVVAKLLADPKGAYFEIEGHTDNVGPAELNQSLGLARAEAVKKYLYEQYKIPLFRINVISYGQEKPAADNKTKEGRAQNRRVVIRVLA